MTKKLQFSTTFYQYNSVSELPNDIQQLMQQAVEARKKAYAPYSQFKVGAALALDNQKIITGNNQENASYPSGLCAERVAVFNAGSQYPNAKILAIAITASSNKNEVKEPVPPCGACRQTIAEYEIKQKHLIQIYFMGETGKIIQSDSLKNLLPLLFESTFL